MGRKEGEGYAEAADPFLRLGVLNQGFGMLKNESYLDVQRPTETYHPLEF